MADNIRTAVDTLFREAFEGRAPDADGTWYVQSGESLFESLREISAARASVRVNDAGSSIGAHVRHLTYYLWFFNEHARAALQGGEGPDADWAGSWAVQEFDETTWKELQAELAEEYAFTRNLFADPRALQDPRHLIPSIANVAHASFHLGAIRALMPLVP